MMERPMISIWFRVICQALVLSTLSIYGAFRDTELGTQLDMKVKSELNYLEVKLASMLECAALCAKDEICMSASFNDEDGSCELSNQRSGGTENQGNLLAQTSWSVLSKHACKEPTIRANVDLSSGYSIVGSRRTFTCTDGHFYHNGNEYVTILTAECLKETLNWTLDNIGCIAGSKVGGSCGPDITCVDTGAFCSESLCFCDAMFVYNTTVEDCIPRCSTVLDTFDAYNGKWTDGFDAWKFFTSGTANECKVACLQQAKCFHYEYWASGNCVGGKLPYNIMAEMKPSAVYSGNCDIYSRRCE